MELGCAMTNRRFHILGFLISRLEGCRLGQPRKPAPVKREREREREKGEGGGGREGEGREREGSAKEIGGEKEKE